jgi:hypothetical protein
MLLDTEFSKNNKIIRKHMNADGRHHIIWRSNYLIFYTIPFVESEGNN